MPCIRLPAACWCRWHIARTRWAAGVVLMCSLVLGLPGGTYESMDVDRRKEMQREVRVIIGLLENLHYRSRTFVEMPAEEILAAYMHRLDPMHLVFLGSDEKFLRRRFGTTMKSSYLLSGDLYPAYEIYDLFRERWSARSVWLTARLQREFDLEQDIEVRLDRSAAEFPARAAAADAEWERVLTGWIIGEHLDGRSEDDALEAVRRRVERLDRAVTTADVEWIQETFLNAVLELRDPHSGYHSWDSMLDLEVDLAGAFVGVGIEVRRMDGHVVVVHLAPGGAAEATGSIRVGDRIMAVAEGETPARDTRDMHVREVVRRLRGAEGSGVRLFVQSETDGSPREVVLQRRRISAEADRARAYIMPVPGGGGAPQLAIGVIALPAFYGSPGAPGAEAVSSAADVAELLGKLSARGVAGVVLDLRDNPGGSVDEAVRIAGLFLESGPVMYLAGGDGRANTKPSRLDDATPGMAWTGPLVVLTSASSASASEVVAGALQAYGRAIVIGSGATFGKGTAQSVIPLNDAAQRLGIAGDEHFGMLRITGQMYFLPDGRSTQALGVPSDIVLASASRGSERREADLPGALPWSSIPVENFEADREAAVPPAARLATVRREHLMAASAERAAGWEEFAWDRRRLAYRERRDGVVTVSLSLVRRREERAAFEDERRSLTAERRRLAAALDTPQMPVWLDAVQRQRETHARVLDASTSGDAPQPALIHARVFAYRPTADAPWVEMRLDRVDPRLLLDEAEELVPAFARAAGRALDVDTFRLACLAWRDDEFSNPEVMERELASGLGLAPDAAAFKQGWLALFSRLVALHPWLAGQPVPLDVPLREAARIAADWAKAQDIE